jgi:hypothetical protein
VVHNVVNPGWTSIQIPSGILNIAQFDKMVEELIAFNLLQQAQASLTERAFLLNSSGTLLDYIQGNTSSVPLPVEYISDVSGGGFFIHNHPTNLPPSIMDVVQLASLQDINVIAVTSSDVFAITRYPPQLMDKPIRKRLIQGV